MRRDKALHLIAGIAIMAVFTELFNPLIGWMAVVTIGGLKEVLYDGVMGRGNSDFEDFVYTAAIPTIIFILTIVRNVG
jgi:hypothetical protein